GDLVLTGSLLQSRFPNPGDVYEFDVEGLGGVKVSVSD
ncbi:MAG: 2-keto-4-pentenoate hydratase, partial [Rhizobiales bacterium]|nr:2-keto-4-pentenoate hydratase [Hyphomicrobiales bacterium]